MNVQYVFYDKFYIAGPSFSPDYERIINEVPIGAEVTFMREPNNAYDSNAIVVYYKGYKLGYIWEKSLGLNEKYARLLDRSLTEIFYATISHIDLKRHDKEFAVEVSVYLRLDGASCYSLTAEEVEMIEAVKNLDLSGILDSFAQTNKKGDLIMPTLGAMLKKKQADVAFTTIWTLDDIIRQHQHVSKEERPSIDKAAIYSQDDEFIGEYFSPLKRDDEYPLICIYLNRIDYFAKDALDRQYCICHTFIHECMHALFDHKPRTKHHPHDSFLEEATCECGAIMIAKELDRHYPGFGDYVFNSVNRKTTKYGLGADLYLHWSNSKEMKRNAVDDYNYACDQIVFKSNCNAVNGWKDRWPYDQAIPEMKEIYNLAHRSPSNQSDKPEQKRP